MFYFKKITSKTISFLNFVEGACAVVAIISIVALTISVGIVFFLPLTLFKFWHILQASLGGSIVLSLLFAVCSEKLSYKLKCFHRSFS